MADAQPRRPKATFVQLLRDALATVGIEYLTPEDIRRAKTSSVSATEFDDSHALLCIPFWRALHDLCLVILADFNVDAMAVAAQSRALFDEPDGFDVCVEVARYHLYEWGFLCHEFYTTQSPLTLPGPILLAALVFLFGQSHLFSRQATAIVRRQLGQSHVHLPPYPDAPPLIASHVQDTFAMAARRTSHIRAPCSEWHALQKAHKTLLTRIRTSQLAQLGTSKVLMDDEGIAASVLSPYELWLLQHPEELRLHRAALDQRLQNYADEKQFYQWAIAAVTQGLKVLPPVGEREEPPPPQAFEAVVASATATNAAWKARLPLYKTVCLHWKSGISAKEKAKFKTKIEAATAKMTDELPVVGLLFTPIKPKPIQAACALQFAFTPMRCKLMSLPLPID
ncbi:hypothetical protein SPRG_21251 [Saprolegnia parasitica CBS 223.65]|uniref:Tubulin epsilon and delta complex protein 1 domain-containing protein n=1 Tax=Saprolegnia parasitica (strain CBS 223.65) TaxID=695850 RepID=A0A067BST8_SAPPC|nr:hypothetical protein SPRG_21251 [Saprolegnia parasitica CBS 223.65]KDO21318.1 hypothetical protein SPRG_21251 [Saprolegnia parasitica CBS 223.65]|eukprot:XP_012207991.1 hypothetical protein SPRG_21251 [Saprolegnia parasitica CBS 223.65]